MDRLIATNSVPQAQADTALLTGTPEYATDGNPATGVPATQWTAAQYNAIQEELIALIAASGETPDRTNNAQIIASLLKLFRDGAANYCTDTGVVNAYAGALSPAPAALTPGMIVSLHTIVASNTGPATLNINGLGAIPIQSSGGVALQGGELVATYGAIFQLNGTGTAWKLVYTSGGSLPVKSATKTGHPINLGQLQTYVPISASAATAGNNSAATASVSFTAPCAGLLLAWGSSNLAAQGAASYEASLSINGVQVSADTSTLTQAHAGSAPIAAGQAVSAAYTATASLLFTSHVTLLFIPNSGALS